MKKKVLFARDKNLSLLRRNNWEFLAHSLKTAKLQYLPLTFSQKKMHANFL
jgi:hypothetical protein